MKTVRWARFFVFFSQFANVINEESNENVGEEDENYGKTWMYIPDGNETPRIANLTEETEENSDNYFENDINFYLYTRRNTENFTEIFIESEDSMNNEVETQQMFKRYFDPKGEVIIVTHGWLSSQESESVTLIRDAYLNSQDINVIAVDWERLANNLFYVIPAHNTEVVGKKTARLVDYLIMEFGMFPEQFHLIGHSLGAHVCGYAGRNVKSGKIGRITGLDPAKPGFENFSIHMTGLNPNDAQFVDIIHTAAGVVGYLSELGHVDFYPNGGTPPQPGCGSLFPILEACSHGRSYRFYAESVIYPRGFLSWKCNSAKDARAGNCDKNQSDDNNTISMAFMGAYVSYDVRGPFYTTTNSDPPFHQNDE